MPIVAEPLPQPLHMHRDGVGVLRTAPHRVVDLTLAEWLRKWLVLQLDLRDLSEGTYELYRAHVENYWIPQIGKLRMPELKADRVGR